LIITFLVSRLNKISINYFDKKNEIITNEISNGRRKINRTENDQEIKTAAVVIGCCRR
jgi:hypothetical protein